MKAFILLILVVSIDVGKTISPTPGKYYKKRDGFSYDVILELIVPLNTGNTVPVLSQSAKGSGFMSPEEVYC